MLEWLVAALPILADNVLGYTLDQSGLGEKLREKLKPDTEKIALQNALKVTFGHFQQKYPQLVDEQFMRTSFEDRKSAAILGQLLSRTGKLNSDDLANLWATRRYPNDETLRANSLNTFKPIASDFFAYLSDALKAEPALQELFNNIAIEQTAQGVTRIDKSAASLDENVAAIRRKLDDNIDLTSIRTAYLRWLIERNLYLDVRGVAQTQRQVQVKLEEVYIMLRAQRDDDLSSSERSLLDKELLDIERHTLRSEEIDDQRDLLTHHFQRGKLSLPDRSAGEIRDLSTIVAQHERLIILGDPGSGKTTLLRYLALQHAQALQNNVQEASSELGKTRFPILLRIADYAELGKGKSVTKFLADYHNENHECSHPHLAELFAEELASGNCLILLDGLDEITSIDDRMRVVRQIEEFVRHHSSAGNRFVITSRVAGYRNARLTGDYAHYKVQDMDETQIQHFLDMWCPAVEYAQTPDLSLETRKTKAQREINGIMHAVQHTPGVKRLAANPLLLCTLALIHRTGATLPQKRIDLYKLAAEVLTRTWRVAQGVRSTELMDDADITKLLRELAYWMHVHKPTGIATEREIIKLWARVNNKDEDDEQSENDIKIFLRKVEEHTGLFVERSPKRYGFMHLTFEEYYAARYLIARSRTRAQLIRQHLHEPRWEEPILLALGFVNIDSPEDAAELVDTAILAQSDEAEDLGFKPSKYEDLLGRDYLFALRCLGDQIAVSEKTMHQLIERLTNELLYRSGLAQYSRYSQALDERLVYLKGSKFVADTFIPRLLTILRDSEQEENVRSQAAVYLGMVGIESVEVVAELLTALKADKSESVRSQAAQSLGEARVRSVKVENALLNALKIDKSEWVRLQAVCSLGEIGVRSVKVKNALLNAFKIDAAEHVRSFAVQSLGQVRMGSAELVGELLRTLREDASEIVRERAVWSFWRQETKASKVVNELLRVLKEDKSKIVCEQAIWSLERVESAKVIAGLLTLLKESEVEDVRSMIAQSLGQVGIGSAKAIAGLLTALKEDKAADVRLWAAESLGQVGAGSAKAITGLVSALKGDVDVDVRYRAAVSLVQLTQKITDKDFNVLLTALKNSSWSTRQDAARLIGRFGEDSTQNIQDLHNGLLDENRVVRTACVRGLVLFARRFPDTYETIEKLFMQAIEQPEFDKQDNIGRSAHNYAYDGLWLLVVGGEIEDEDVYVEMRDV